MNSITITAKKTMPSYDFFGNIGIVIPVKITVQDEHPDHPAKRARYQFDVLMNGFELFFSSVISRYFRKQVKTNR